MLPRTRYKACHVNTPYQPVTSAKSILHPFFAPLQLEEDVGCTQHCLYP